MRRPPIILMVMVLAGAAMFFAGEQLAAHWRAKQMAGSSDDLAWLQVEFRLSEADLARVRELHNGYLPKCHNYCEQIDAQKLELQAMLASGSNAPIAIKEKLIEIGTLRAQCQAAMLQHFRDVSAVMPQEQGRRYLAEMQRLTLGFHEQIEHAMPSNASSPHGHP